MGGGASKSKKSAPESDRRRNDAPPQVWRQATSSATIASIARLEAVANAEAQNKDNIDPLENDEDFVKHGCRLAYSSALAVSTREEAQKLLAQIFTLALTRNPEKGIGGMLFYDEKTNAIVQVLEGPAPAVRSLFYDKIIGDTRHTAVKVLWDIDVDARRFEGFGMKLGKTEEELLGDGAAAVDQQGVLRLTYISKLTAASRDAAYADIQAILGCAIVTNPKLHIGGALFLNPRTLHVLQVLEGPQHNVRTLYDKIAKDSRHTDCKVEKEEQVTERAYDQWGMLQGDSSQADWSPLRGFTNPKRRRGRENVLGEPPQEGNADKPTSDGGGDGNSDAALKAKLKEAETRAKDAEERAKEAEAKLASVRGPADAIEATPLQTQAVGGE